MQPAYLAGREIHLPHAHVLVLQPQMGRDRSVLRLLNHRCSARCSAPPPLPPPHGGSDLAYDASCWRDSNARAWRETTTAPDAVSPMRPPPGSGARGNPPPPVF